MSSRVDHRTRIGQLIRRPAARSAASAARSTPRPARPRWDACAELERPKAGWAAGSPNSPPPNRHSSSSCMRRSGIRARLAELFGVAGPAIDRAKVLSGTCQTLISTDPRQLLRLGRLRALEHAADDSAAGPGWVPPLTSGAP